MRETTTAGNLGKWKRGGIFSLLVAAALSLLIAPPASAAVFTWDESGSGDWNNSGNWTLDSGTSVLGYPSVAGDTAQLHDTLSSSSSITLTGSASVGHVEIDSGFSYTITESGSPTLTFDNGGTATSINVISGSHTFDVNINLDDNITITNSGVGVLSFENAFSDVSGGHDITKAGTGMVEFNASSNTFDGDVYVTEGILRLSASNATGNNTNFDNRVDDGATLQVTNNITQTEGEWEIEGTGVGGLGAINNLSGSNTLNGQINLNDDASIVSSAGTLTLGGSGGIGVGNNTLTIDGAGAVIVNKQINGLDTLVVQGSGSKSFTGSQINAVSGAREIIVNGTGNHTFSTTIGASDYTQNGSGTVTFSGSGNNNFNGVATVNNGTLVLDKSGYAVSELVIGDSVNAATVRLDRGNQIKDYNSVLINSGSTLNLNGNNDSIGTLEMTEGTVNTGSGRLGLQTGSNGIVTNAGAVASTINGNLRLENYRPDIVVADGAAANDLLINAQITGSGNQGFRKYGDGRLTLTNNGNSFSGAIEIHAGTLSVSTNGQLGATQTDIDFWGGTLEATSSFTIAQQRGFSVQADSTIDITDANTVVLANGGSAYFTGNASITKEGTGTLQLDRTMNLGGDVIINEGTLLLGASDRIGNNMDMTLGGGTFATGGNNETLATLTLTATSTLDLGASDTSVLNFSSSNGIGWSGTLRIEDWDGSTMGGTGDQIYFGSNASGLDSGQVDSILFFNPGGLAPGIWTAKILGTGEIVPDMLVPEAETYLAGLALALAGFAFEMRRRRKRAA